MSTGLNTIAATVYEDLVLPCLKEQPSEQKASNLMKLLSVIFGIICVCLIYLVEKLGSILEMSISLGGASCGVLLTIFVMGMFVPFGNSKVGSTKKINKWPMVVQNNCLIEVFYEDSHAHERT